MSGAAQRPKAFSSRDMPPAAPETQRAFDEARGSVDAKIESHGAEEVKYPQWSAAHDQGQGKSQQPQQQQQQGSTEKNTASVTKRELGGGAEPGAGAEREMTAAGGGAAAERQAEQLEREGRSTGAPESSTAAGVQDIE